MVVSISCARWPRFLAFVYIILALPLAAAERPSDKVIVNRIEAALFEDPRVRAADISVNSMNGIVTLDGSVKTLAELKFADLETKKIRGVLGVIDKLSVRPVYRLDAEIRQDLRRRLVRSSIIKSENLGVHVENGIVYLSGKVGSSAERDQASLLVEDVRGVKAIDNRIEVTYAIKRSDADIRKDILSKYSRDVYLVGLPIGVTVKNGNVTLTGEIGNEFEKERAENDAANTFNVAGVRNDLKVTWAKAEGVRNEASAISDTELTVAVGNELSWDTRFDNPKDIVALVRHGAITLTGSVPAFSQKMLAEQDVKGITGVQSVNNLLQVKGVERDDMGIYMDIRDAMESDYSLNGVRITYYVVDGVATLKGNVNSEYEKSRIERDAGGIIGVKDIDDYITVDWLPKYSDDALKNRIFERLLSNWVTWPLTKSIIINVNEGRAILTGTTDTWAQYNEAQRITGQTDGIRSVDNRLVVHGS